ncbi:MAG: hypothetical protein AAF902_03050 [Chloroflexota bacterium]
MKMNLPLDLNRFPIEPDHIEPALLFDVAQKVVMHCQKKGGWFPFRVSELAGVTSYQLGQIRGLYLVNDRCFITPSFVQQIFLFAPAVSQEDQAHLHWGARLTIQNTLGFHLQNRLPEMIALLTWILVGCLMSPPLGSFGSYLELILNVLTWPIGAQKLPALIMWLSMILIGILLIQSPQKRLFLTGAQA